MNERMFIGWTARLAGEDWSLQELAAGFTQGRHQIKHEDGSYHLTSLDLAACDTDSEAWKVAERIVGNINFAAKLVDPGFRPVHVEVVTYTGPESPRRSYARASLDAVVVARAQLSATVTRADGTVETVGPAPSPIENFVELLECQGVGSAVSRAVEQWNLPQRTPTSLNNVLEIIRDDVSGGDPDKGRAWGTMAGTLAPAMAVSPQQLDDELRRCRDSLHDPSAVGPLARHGSPRPVTNPMDLRQADDFVHRLLLVWLRSKI